jgi:hypothetical protein
VEPSSRALRLPPALNISCRFGTTPQSDDITKFALSKQDAARFPKRKPI